MVNMIILQKFRCCLIGGCVTFSHICKESKEKYIIGAFQYVLNAYFQERYSNYTLNDETSNELIFIWMEKHKALKS